MSKLPSMIPVRQINKMGVGELLIEQIRWSMHESTRNAIKSALIRQGYEFLALDELEASNV